MKPPFSLLTVCGIEELEAHSARGITHVLSIVDPDLPELEVFGRFAAHRRTVLRFHDAIEPEPGIVLPRREDVEQILAFGHELETDADIEGHLLVHCHMGISRSTAAMMMVLAQAHPGEAEQDIAERLRAIRPIAWPNLVMVSFADELLDRGGRLVEAASRLYAGNLASKPHLADTMTRMNRAREVELGQAAARAAG